MQEQNAAYVAREDKPALPPPKRETGPFATARRNFFPTPLDAILTILAGGFLVWAVWQILNWAVFNAVFVGSDRSACLVEGGGHGGACWAFVEAKFGQFMYGTYPRAERWRPDVVFALLAILTAGLLIPGVPQKRLNAFLLFAVFPFVALVLLTGGEFTLTGGEVAILVLGAAIATFLRAASVPEVQSRFAGVRAAGWLIAGAIVLLGVAYLTEWGDLRLAEIRFSLPSALALLLLLGATGLAAQAGMGGRPDLATVLRYAAPLLLALGLVLLLSLDFGLRPVATNLWGGLLVTLAVALTGIAASLPLGILLALGRRSHMPVVRFLSIVFIEFWRGVPLITVLFMANFMLPLFLPAGVNFDQLLRILVGVTLFSSAYMAEVIRGGLQAIPRGQYEGADAMALTYWQKMRLIILPQALKLVIPGVVNTFIGLFKDTSLVYIIGLADLLGTVRRGFNDPNWITPATPATGLVFAGFVFWLFCFSMSRYSLYVERRLDTGHTR